MTALKLTVRDDLAQGDFILCLVLGDDSLKFAGQGLKFRQNPLHPIGWRKLTTAEQYAKTIETTHHVLSEWNVKEIQVCKRQTTFACLSSIAILKQDREGNHERD